MTQGKHIIAELRDCANSDLNGAFITTILEKAALDAGMRVLNSHFHDFQGQGCTVLIMLAESHISAHTWPEKQYIAMDIFCCGDVDPKSILDRALELFKPTNYEVLNVERG